MDCTPDRGVRLGIAPPQAPMPDLKSRLLSYGDHLMCCRAASFGGNGPVWRSALRCGTILPEMRVIQCPAGALPIAP